MITIYALTCMENGKAYIGCTSGKLSKRFREHKSLLNAERHKEPYLMADWKLYGVDRFTMYSVYGLEDDAPVKAKRAMEQFAMNRYKNLGLLYNLNESCFMPTKEAIAKGHENQRRGFTQTPESNEKRRLAQLGIPKNHGHKISATKQAKKVVR